MLVDEDADLLVARPQEAQMACECGNAAMNLSDRNRFVVETLDRSEQCWADARSGGRHSSTVAETASRNAHKTVPIHAK